MRGKVAQFMKSEYHIRITPAYAGKSGVNNGGVKCHRDHPRLCGEKRTGHVFALTGLGSPPPMRGKDVNLYKQNRN